MNAINSAGKIFLCVASYTRTADNLINQAFMLGQTNGQYYYVEGGIQNYYCASWDPIYYRMAHSYLARFLLSIPRSNPTKFGFSFQPGFIQYQFIPYYSIWNAKLGTPSEDGFRTVSVNHPELPDT